MKNNTGKYVQIDCNDSQVFKEAAGVALKQGLKVGYMLEGNNPKSIEY